MIRICTCIRNLAVTASKQDATLIPDDLKHYLEPNDFNQMFYYQRSSEINENIPQILADVDKLIELCKPVFSESDDYKLLTRCLSEQTIVEDEKRRLPIPKKMVAWTPISFKSPIQMRLSVRKQENSIAIMLQTWRNPSENREP